MLWRPLIMPKTSLRAMTGSHRLGAHHDRQRSGPESIGQPELVGDSKEVLLCISNKRTCFTGLTGNLSKK